MRHLLLFPLTLLGLTSLTAAEPARAEIVQAIRRAGEFYASKVARHGGYVYYTSLDGERRLGEGVASSDQIWVQPPGTPAVGEALLEAFRSTGEAIHLDDALAAGRALVHGQLESGGWTNAIDFDPAGTQAARYRNGKGKAKGRNFSTLDDDITQAALRFLIDLDAETKQEHAEIHGAVEIALAALLKAQFPNGAFPQGWDEELHPGGDPGARARYPEHDWRTEGRIKEYWDCYTLNDGLALTVAETLIRAEETYGRDDCREALRMLGEFLVCAQMPAPQPGWAQQYNNEMEPIWARKFEPAALSGRESETSVAALLRIAVHLREKAFLEPIPEALSYLADSHLPDGQLARYYELESNRPLYMERRGKEYHLTYSDANLPSHYGWKTESRLAHLRSAWRAVGEREPLPDPLLPELEEVPCVAEVLAALDTEGRWVSTHRAGDTRLVGQPKFAEGEQYLDSAIFCRNMRILAAACRGGR